MFTMEGIQNLLSIFPKLNDPVKISFCLTVLFQFSEDPKTAGTVMMKGGKDLYDALYNNLTRGNAQSQLLIMKILNQLLSYSSTAGPMEKFPSWDIIAQFTNLSYQTMRDKDIDLFSQASVTLLRLSQQDDFMERVRIVDLLVNYHDGIERQVYGERQLEMKGIILEVRRGG